MVSTHAEESVRIAAAIRPLATKKELDKAEQRFKATHEVLRNNLIEELRDRDKQIRTELQSELKQELKECRTFSPAFSLALESLFFDVLVAIVIFTMSLGFVQIFIYLWL